MRFIFKAATLLAGLSAFIASAESPRTPSPPSKAKSVVALPIAAAPVVLRCPVVNMTFQFAPTGVDASGWNGHTENKTNVAVAALTKRKNAGLEYDTVFCVYNLNTDGDVIQDDRLTIVERNAPPDHPICDAITQPGNLGWSCRALKPGETYQ